MDENETRTFKLSVISLKDESDWVLCGCHVLLSKEADRTLLHSTYCIVMTMLYNQCPSFQREETKEK